MALSLLLMAGCVSTPLGTKFDPVEGVRHLDDNLETTINRWQDRTYHDVN